MLIDGSLSTESFRPDTEFIATHIQHDELSKTRDAARRSKLLNRFSSLIDSTLPTETAILGTSKLGSCRMGVGTMFAQLKADLDLLNHGNVITLKMLSSLRRPY